MKSDIQKTFALLPILLLLTSCISPIYDGDTESLLERHSVWQYLNVFSLYHERLPDQLDNRTPEELFDIIDDTFCSGDYCPRYTGYYYKPIETRNNAAAALEAQNSRYLRFLISDSTMYIRIPDFFDNSFELFKNDVMMFRHYKNIIIDLRNNGGGSVDICDYIVSEFLPFNSEYIQFEYRTYDRKNLKGKTVLWETQRTANREPRLRNKNIAILMNHNSASSSEILISALKDKNNAHLIGGTTFGKGIGQVIIPRLGRKSLSITSMKIRGLTNRTGEYHEKGISPDQLNSEIWDESGMQYEHQGDLYLRNLYYAAKYLEPSASSSKIKDAIKENISGLPKTSPLAKTAPIGAYFILEEDPFNN